MVYQIEEQQFMVTVITVDRRDRMSAYRSAKGRV